ncbi:hypothetical protein NLU13_7039 [Sarocladium strictum]|uniref:Uncharacterized protein n=1 Tax=Sarocladium strictum TaxID=5046 RepID=A0AA39L6G0_SARSR|nr:hypothetical protein NLU13_7039 [Sarocladium strictum]
MEFLGRLLGQATPERIDSDDVYPLHMLDDTKTLRGITLTWILRFDDVLDADKLHDALVRLLDMGDWRKLGGRLRLNGQGALEVHVPRPFTPDRPAVTYTHVELDVDMEDHELAKKLPEATDTLSIQPSPDDFHVFAAHPHAPKTMNDFIYHDTPVLSLHITSFRNATLIGLSWPHVLMDVMGQRALLQAWSLVVSGHDADVPPALGAREDALRAAVNAAGPEEDYEMGKQRLKGAGFVSFAVRYAWALMRGPAPEGHTIYMPAKTLAALRREAEADLKELEGGLPFLTDNNILTAWAARIVASSQPHPRPVTVLTVINTRFRLPALFKAPGVFVQNMAVAGFTPLPPDEARGPLGRIALSNRQHISAQATEGQVRAVIRETQNDPEGADRQVLCGPSDGVLMPLTNWERAQVLESADFGAAVVKSGRSTKTGFMTCHYPASITALRPQNLWAVLGRDQEGGYWLVAYLTPAAWGLVEKTS